MLKDSGTEEDMDTKARDNSRVSISLQVALEPAVAFDLTLSELRDALAREGIDFEPKPNGKVIQSGFEVGTVSAWQAGQEITVRWRPADWLPDTFSEVGLRFQKLEGGTRIEIEHIGFAGLIGEADEVAGWFAGEVTAPFLRVVSPARFGDWVTDRKARRPAGKQARSIYGDPIFHYPNFRVILAELGRMSGGSD